MLRLARKAVRIVVGRVRTQGFRTTAIWAYARGIPAITGTPMLKYSRVTPQLFVGPQYQKSGKRLLEQEGIHYGVNMRIEFDDAEHGLALKNYCHLPTVDDDPPAIEHLQQGADFIHKAITDDGKVYIHCTAGVGRAPTMASAYLISQGHKLDEAIALIEKARPFIKMMPVQIEQLRRFEALIRSQ